MKILLLLLAAVAAALPPSPRSRAQVVAGMAALRPRLIACHDKYGGGGLGVVALTLEPDGRVSSARVAAGDYLGTSVGACIIGVVGAARFEPLRPTGGAPEYVEYPITF